MAAATGAIQDVAVIGGSFAGLSAAIQVARARRNVTIIDSTEPRNRFASHSQGVLALDGVPGSEILATARKQVAAYSTATFETGEVQSITGAKGDFHIHRKGVSTPLRAKRIVLATGVKDNLPDIPGVEERWGDTVMTCPYCHGYEIGQGAIGLIAAAPTALHHALIVSEWGDVTVFTTAGCTFSAEATAALHKVGVTIETSPVKHLAEHAPGSKQIDVCLEDGRSVCVKAVFVATGLTLSCSLAKDLGCEIEDGPMGQLVKTVSMFSETTVPGVYCAGDAAKQPSNISIASANGVLAGIGAHQSLVMEKAGM